MELKVVFSKTEPTNKNAVWINSIDGVLIQKVFTANGWQIVGSPILTKEGQPSLYEEYVNNGGTKSKQEFNAELFDLIG